MFNPKFPNELTLNSYDIGLPSIKGKDGNSIRMGLQTMLLHDLVHMNDPLYHTGCTDVLAQAAVGATIQKLHDPELNSGESWKELQSTFNEMRVAVYERYAHAGEKQFNSRYYPDEPVRATYESTGQFLESRMRLLDRPQSPKELASIIAAHLHTGPMHGGLSGNEDTDTLRHELQTLPGCKSLPRNKGEMPIR